MSRALRLIPMFGLLLAHACAKPNQGDPGAGGPGPSGTGGNRPGGGGAPGTGGSGPTGTGGVPGTGGVASPGTGGFAPSGIDASVGGDAPAAEGGTPGDPATPGATDLAKHRFSKVVTMDTTPAGANVPADVAKYPVAVLLTAANFDFSQAKPAGEDIRFATAAGALLPYSIEQWDAAGKVAAIWVKVDVKGNSNAQSFVMHWGNPAADSASSSKTVFNKEDGYLGVYHLNDEGGNTPDGYKDASWNEAHLTGRNMDAETRQPARVGQGVSLTNPGGQGKNQWIGGEGPKFESEFNATAAHGITGSAWALGNSFSGYYETVISKGDRSWTLQRDYQGRMETCTWSGSYHACAITKGPTVKKWTHYMVVQNTKSLTLYVDGKRAAGTGSFGQTSTHGFAISHNLQAHNDAAVGKREWDGQFDEARVMSVEKDANWAQLEFESQREGSKFLSFGATTMK